MLNSQERQTLDEALAREEHGFDRVQEIAGASARGKLRDCRWSRRPEPGGYPQLVNWRFGELVTVIRRFTKSPSHQLLIIPCR